MTQGHAPGPRARVPFGAEVGLAALVVGAVLITALLHEVAVGKAEMAAADAAVARSDWPEAVWHARAAAEAFVPGSPWPERGMGRLDSIASDAAIRGDRSVALLAYGALRTAALATRAPGADNARWRAVAEDGLVRLAASPDAPRDSGSAMRSDLRDPGLPSGWALAALSLSVLTILGGVARLARVAWLSPQAFVAKVLIAAGFAAYAGALLLS